jgi:hypothetical protein
MLKELLLLFLICWFCNWAFAQQADISVRMTGTILDAENGEPLPGVHLVPLGKEGTVTDLDGNFILPLTKGDTVRISHIGYNEYLVPVPSRTKNTLDLTIALTPSVTELDEILIYQWPATLSQFKQRVLATKAEEDEKIIIPGSYEGLPKPIKPGVGSPVSFLQSKLSKKIRRRQEFLRKRFDIERTKSAKGRYNQKYVAEITGITDEQELEKFMNYCKLTDAYLARVGDYDLIVTINQCFRDFRSEN